MQINNQELYKTLKDLQTVDVKFLADLYEQAEQNKTSLAELLLEKDLISDENLGQLVADKLGVRFVNLTKQKIPEEVLQIIPEIVAKKQMVIAFKKNEQGLHLAMLNPNKAEVIEFVKKKSGLSVKSYYATKRDLNEAFSLYSKDVKSTFADIIQENIKQVKKSKGVQIDPPIIKIVDTIIIYAYQNKASDIHIEPLEGQSKVRFRIDGVLHDVVDIPLDLHQQIVIRTKVMANLRIDEHQTAQDGKINYLFSNKELSDNKLDLRVSIVPITAGEKIVMRLLSQKSRQFSLQELGFLEDDLKKMQKIYRKPFGMILATGPTGSGKTTTMYAVLKILNKRDVNIMTIEDPVEYDIEGINQIQVNLKTDLDFTSGLRSIVRQDPDIILVGEIRDEVTASIAVNAAMTGHLVLSTLHTNDAATAVPRLLDMKIEPYLLASTVQVIIAQRLVRRICQRCRTSLEINEKNQEKLKGIPKELRKKYFAKKSKVRIYQGSGCSVCHQTGYTGRIGIYELMIIDEVLKEMIVAQKDASQIKQAAIKQGMRTMLEDGIEKIKQGITTVEEILRVTQE